MRLFQRRARAKRPTGLSIWRVVARLVFTLAVLLPSGASALGTSNATAHGASRGLTFAPPCPGDPPPPTCAPGLPCLPDTGGGYCNENPEECAGGSAPTPTWFSRPQKVVVPLSLVAFAGWLLPGAALSFAHPCPGDPPPGGTAPGPTPVPLTPVCAECEAPGVAASVETPEVQVRANPATGLVNLPTWLWAEGYLGQDLFATQSWSPPYEPTTIEVRYFVKRYLWNFGDGGQIESRSLGQPYPAESDIRNAYAWSSRTEPGGYFHLALIIEWHVEYRVNGGAPTPLSPAQRRYEAIYPVQELQPIVTGP